MRGLRIGIDARALSTRPAGIEVYTRCLLREFARQAPGNEYFLYSTRDFELPFSGPFVKRIGTGLLASKGGVWMQAVVPHLCFADRVDLFWSPLQTLPVALPRSIAAVLTVHDFVHRFHPYSMRPGNRALLKALSPPSWRRADAFVTGSMHSGEIIRRAVGPRREVAVVPHGHMGGPPCSRAQAQESVRERFRIGSPFVLGVGTLEPRKNLAALVRAFAIAARGKAAGHALVLAGARGWKYGPIFDEVDRERMQDRVVFTGAVSDAELARLYAAADLFVFPSLYEGFGLPVLEAMAIGAPVACSNAPPMPEVVGDAGLLFGPRDVQGMALAISRVLSDRNLADDLASRGKARAAGFGWDRAASETLAVFERAALLVRRRKPRPPPLDAEQAVFDASASAAARDISPDQMRVTGPASVESSITRESFDFLGKLAGKTFLDFGCGQGHGAIFAALRGARAGVGFDVSLASLRLAAMKAEASGTAGKTFFVCARAERLPFKDGVFDAVQGVYATVRVTGAWELASCSGLWLPREGGRPGLSLWATLSDTGGRVVAGRLFPETPAVSVAFVAREISGAGVGAAGDPWAWPPAGRNAA